MELNKIPNRTEDEKKKSNISQSLPIDMVSTSAPYQNRTEHPFSPPKGKHRNAPDNSVEFHGEKKSLNSSDP